jgi:hypothetical protein
MKKRIIMIIYDNKRKINEGQGKVNVEEVTRFYSWGEALRGVKRRKEKSGEAVSCAWCGRYPVKEP